MQAEKAEQEKEIKKRAFLDEMERRRKADAARNETEAILAAQVREEERKEKERRKEGIGRAGRGGEGGEKIRLNRCDYAHANLATIRWDVTSHGKPDHTL